MIDTRLKCPGIILLFDPHSEIWYTIYDFFAGDESDTIEEALSKLNQFKQYPGYECPCTIAHYCLMGNSCESRNENVSCFNADSEWDSFVLYCPLFIVSLYSFILLMLFCTSKGKDVREYFTREVILPILPSCPQQQQEITTNPFWKNVSRRFLLWVYSTDRIDNQVNEIYEQQMNERRFRHSVRSGENNESQLRRFRDDISLLRFGRRPVEMNDIIEGRVKVKLVIRTRRYDKDSLGILDCEKSCLEDEVLCSICLCEVDVGDKVGDLQICKHIFHSDCLKTWLSRKNCCPLCQSDDVSFLKAYKCSDIG